MRAFLSMLAAVALALVMVGAVSATPSERTFHGTWTSSDWSGCEAGFDIPDGEYAAAGTWNVTLMANGVDALAQWNMWDGTGHYAFGGNKLGMDWTVDSAGAGPSFVLENSVYWPAVLTVNAGFITVAVDYGSYAPGCTSVAYGVLVR